MATVIRSTPAMARDRAVTGKWMDSMDDHTDASPNAKVLLLAAGGAALVALLVALSRRDEEDKEAGQRVEEAAAATKAKQEEVAAAVKAEAEAAERELKAAAWDAQQRAREAEGRLRAAGLRVVDDAAQVASRVGSGARSLAGEGKERIAQLRHRETEEPNLDDEVRRLHDEIDTLKRQLRKETAAAERDVSSLTALFGKKGGPVGDALSSPPIAAALTQLERSLRAKAPALASAKSKNQVLDILMQDIGPTMREVGMQAFAAAVSGRETARGAKDRLQETLADARDTARDAEKDAHREVSDAADELRATAEDVSASSEAALSNGKRRFWRARSVASELGEDAAREAEEKAAAAEEEMAAAAETEHDEERHGKAGLFWGGAGIGLALYALLDAERREKVLRLANDASVQIQELVRDLQGYDDEF
jgi:colicin import membrane protein